MKLIASLLLFLCINASASTLLFTNVLPAETNTPAYYAGMQAIADAVNNGSRIHCSLSLMEAGGPSTFYSNIIDVKVESGYHGGPIGIYNYASGILDMRPHINNDAQAIGASPLTSGSMDSLGQYWYNGVMQTGYVISWWAD